MFFMGVCRLLGRLLSVACGMHRYVFYRCVSIALFIARTAYIIAPDAYAVAFIA